MKTTNKIFLKIHLRWLMALLCCAVAGLPLDIAFAADHGDTPLLKQLQRHDARLTGLFAFTRGAKLVLIVGLDPTIPKDVTNYKFSSDLRVNIFIDNDSPVSFANPSDVLIFGGTVERPDNINDDIAFKFTFAKDGKPRLNVNGPHKVWHNQIKLFAGLRDDPFIRGPRIGRNIAALVIEIPLAAVIKDQDTILVWATSKVNEADGLFQDLAGRALRSQFPENDEMNTLRPRHHLKNLGKAPDVVIFDASKKAAFPNGRELIDDVLNLVGDPRPLANDQPFPATNDVPFLTDFPYLAPPHPPI